MNLNRRFFLKALALFGLVPTKAIAEDHGLPVVKFDGYNNMSNHKELLSGIPFKSTNYYNSHDSCSEYTAEREVWVNQDDVVEYSGTLKYGKMILRNTYFKYPGCVTRSSRYYLCPIADSKEVKQLRRCYVYETYNAPA